jgi:hypothetical protein
MKSELIKNQKNSEAKNSLKNSSVISDTLTRVPSSFFLLNLSLSLTHFCFLFWAALISYSAYFFWSILILKYNLFHCLYWLLLIIKNCWLKLFIFFLFRQFKMRIFSGSFERIIWSNIRILINSNEKFQKSKMRFCYFTILQMIFWWLF